MIDLLNRFSIGVAYTHFSATGYVFNLFGLVLHECQNDYNLVLYFLGYGLIFQLNKPQ